MSKKQDFIKYVEGLISDVNYNEIPENVRIYWEAFKSKEEVEKPMFTDTGKMILNFLRENSETCPAWKARDIAEGLFISSRSVSGSIRKLVNDGFVEKVSEDPVIYSITDLGKTVEII